LIIPSNDIMDMKLRKLIKICCISGNYDKITSTCLDLIGNLVNDFGIKLGIRPKDIKNKEFSSDYMELINQIFKNNFSIQIFSQDLIIKLRKLELAKLRNRILNFPNLSKQALEIYLDLKKIEVPNLFKIKKEIKLINIPEIRLYSKFYDGNIEKSLNKNPELAIKSLLIHKIEEKERVLKEILKNGFQEGVFEEIIKLKYAKNALIKSKKEKNKIEGKLKDDINYQLSLDKNYGYLLLGGGIVFSLITFLIIVECLLFSGVANSFSIFILLFGIPSFLFISLYKRYYFMRE